MVPRIDLVLRCAYKQCDHEWKIFKMHILYYV